MNKTIKQRVDEFRKKNPRKQLTYTEMDELYKTGNNIITYAYYFGYIRGMRARKGGARL